MRPTPRLSSASAYPVTSATALLAVIATLGYLGGWDATPLLMDRHAFSAQPWRLVTSALPHGDPFHLLFNLYWLWVFGTALEERLGRLALLGLFTVLAVASSAAEYAVGDGGIGLSGVGYGLFGLLYALRRDPRFEGTIDSRTVQLFIAWFFVCIALTYAKLWQIGNTAHGVGAVLGFVIGHAVAARRRRATAGVTLISALAVAIIAGSFVSATRFRPYLNLSEDAGLEDGQLGYEALGENKDAEAITHFERAVRLSPKQPTLWYNLGVAYHRTGQLEPAANAFRRAAALEPGNPTYAEAARDWDGVIPPAPSTD